MQAEQLTVNLARQGVRPEEFMFSSSGANRLPRSLFTALRDRALSLPDDDETRAEFIATRLVETGPGTVKLQNPPGTHDDIVTTVGMLVTDRTAKPDVRGSVSPSASVEPTAPQQTPGTSMPVPAPSIERPPRHRRRRRRSPSQ